MTTGWSFAYHLVLVLVYYVVTSIRSTTSLQPPKSCSAPSTAADNKLKFKSKTLQFGFRDTSTVVQIELVDMCFAHITGFRLASHYEQLDTRVQMSPEFVEFFRSSLAKFDVQVEKVLGKGNYGSVFLARSKHYGRVALKIATNQDAAFYDPLTRTDCCFGGGGASSQQNSACRPCRRRLSELVPFEVATGMLTMDASSGVVKSKAYGVVSAYGRLLFYVLVMEYIENSTTLLAFVHKCFRRFAHRSRLDYIAHVQAQLNDINKTLLRQFNVF